MIHIIKAIINFCLELLYPKRCIACENLLLKMEKDVGFCKACAKKIKVIRDNYCLKCGGELINTQAQYCRNCEKNAHAYTQNKALFRYSGGMKNAMYRFKYSNRRCYAEDFARHTVASYGAWIKEKGIEAIIPVPMNEKKKKRRGYNQAEEYARELGKLLKIPVETEIIRRDEDTVAMKQLNRLKRKKNLLKAFALTKNVVQFRKVLIVDDIYTTGTTLDEVSKVLKGGGVTEVYGMCICIGLMQ